MSELNDDACDTASAEAIARYIAEGTLRVEIDNARPAGFYNTAYVGERHVCRDAPAQLVHVMNPAAGGEIRGYLLIGEKLHLRLPAYAGAWTAMDEAVAHYCGATVVPYKLDAGSMEDTRG